MDFNQTITAQRKSENKMAAPANLENSSRLVVVFIRVRFVNLYDVNEYLQTTNNFVETIPHKAMIDVWHVAHSFSFHISGDPHVPMTRDIYIAVIIDSGSNKYTQ